MKKSFYVTCYLNKSHPGYAAGIEKANEVNRIAFEEGGVKSLEAMEELLKQAVTPADLEMYALCSVEHPDSDNFSSDERDALRAVSEALVIIRSLARQPITKAKQSAIHDLADAFHNVPAHLATFGQQRELNAFLLDAGVKRARAVYHQYGFRSQYLASVDPTETTAESEKPATSDFLTRMGNYPARMMANFFKEKEN